MSIKKGASEYLAVCDGCEADTVEYAYSKRQALEKFKEHEGWSISAKRCLCPKCRRKCRR